MNPDYTALDCAVESHHWEEALFEIEKLEAQTNDRYIRRGLRMDKEAIQTRMPRKNPLAWLWEKRLA